jgi:hypothetical protein
LSVKKLVWVGIVLSGCLLPSVEVDRSLADGGGGTGSLGGQAGTAGAKSNDGGSVTNVVDGGAGADEPGGAPTGGTDAGGTPAGGGTDAGGTGGGGGTGGTGSLGEQQGAYTIFRVKGLLPTHITLGPDNNYWFTEVARLNVFAL